MGTTLYWSQWKNGSVAHYEAVERGSSLCEVWLKDPPSAPNIRVNVWAREGISEVGRFGEKKLRSRDAEEYSLTQVY